jgi:hypothetical protein
MELVMPDGKTHQRKNSGKQKSRKKPELSSKVVDGGDRTPNKRKSQAPKDTSKRVDS